MTNKSPRRSVDAHFWVGRMGQARAYMDAAQQAMMLAQPGQNCSPAVSQMVLAAIAYGDALTARRAQVINQQDHAAAPRLLRDVLRDTLPADQERRYRRLLGLKDEAQYGIRATPRAEVERLFAEIDAFARWAEDLLR